MTSNLVVLIASWNDARELPRTLSAVAAAADRIGHIEVVIAAGGEPGQLQEATQVATQFKAGSCTVLPQRPLGKMRALHDAMEVVSARPSPFLLLLDADTRVDAGGLAEAISSLDAAPQLAGVGGVIRGGGHGVGAAHDAVSVACQMRVQGLHAVSGGAILLRGTVVWPNWEAIFADHDYPLHIDYQICERVVALTGLTFAVCPAFTVHTPRGRGFAFLRAERRHHRAMFARAPVGAYPRYIAGAALNVAIPLVGPLLVPMGLVPLFWPVTVPLSVLSAQRLLALKRRYDLARSVEPAVAGVSFPAFLRDEWVFSLSTLLGAADRVLGRLDGPRFRGYRDRA